MDAEKERAVGEVWHLEDEDDPIPEFSESDLSVEVTGSSGKIRFI